VFFLLSETEITYQDNGSIHYTSGVEPFKRRNIFVGGSIVDNKYELQQTSKPGWSLWSEQDLKNLAASEEVSSHSL
jgi:hypothetical protein